MRDVQRRVWSTIFGALATTATVTGCFSEGRTNLLERASPQVHPRDTPISSNPRTVLPEPPKTTSDTPAPTTPDVITPPPAPPEPVTMPSVVAVVPRILIGGGTVYISGSSFGRDPNDLVVTLRSTNRPSRSVRLAVDEVRPDQIIARIPREISSIEGRVQLSVATRVGTTDARSALSARSENGLGRATRPGRGLVGTVYQLRAGTPLLPNFDDACADPSVVDSPPASPCPFSSILMPNLDVPTRTFTEGFPGLDHDLVEWFAIAFKGVLQIDEPGTYVFDVCSDDGAKVYVDAEPVIVHDGVFPTTCARGEVVLEPGPHAFRVEYFQGPRWEIALQLFWTTPSGERSIIPESAFFMPPDPNEDERQDEDRHDDEDQDSQDEEHARCSAYVGSGCYWMENVTGRYCWLPASWGPTRDICENLDSCDGGGGASGGGCYKWAECSDCEREPW